MSGSRILARPVILSLLGAPGAGKSTTAAEVFVRLKRAGEQVELVTEFAKDLVWEQRHSTLKCQPYILGKQLRNIERLFGQVNIIVTDSPILLSAYYAEINDPERYPDSFKHYVIDQYRSLNSLTYFLKRVKPYNPVGRLQDEAGSDRIAVSLREFLRDNSIKFTEVEGSDRIAVSLREFLRDNSIKFTEVEADAFIAETLGNAAVRAVRYAESCSA